MTLDQGALEDRLRDALRQRAEATPVAGREAPVPSPVAAVLRRGRFLPAALAAAAAAVVAAWLIVATDGEDGHRVATRVPPATTALVVPLPEAPPDGKPPRLVVGLSGASLTRVSESRVDPVATPHRTYLQLFKVPGEAAPLLFVETAPPDMDLTSAASGEQAERRAVNGRAAYLSRNPVRVVSLNIPEPSGGGLVVSAFGLDDDEIVAAAEALVPRLAGAVGVDASRPLPRGLVLSGEGGGLPPAGVHAETEVNLPTGATVRLNLQPAGSGNFERLVQDRVNSAPAVESVSVLGQPGFLVTGAGGTVVMWQPAQGWMAELRTAVDGERARDVVSAVRQVDEEVWVAALPAHTLSPGEQASAAQRLQADIPLPPHTSWAGLAIGSLDPDPNQFKIAVAKYALCAWVKEYRRATSGGDAEEARRALDAISGAPRWTSLREVDAQSGYPEAVAGIASFLAEGRPLAPERPPDMEALGRQGQFVNPEMAFGC